MLGGVGIAAEQGDSRPALAGPRSSSLVLLAGVLAAVVFGLVDVFNPWDTEELRLLRNVKEGLVAVGGALLFGAGLLHLSTWRVDGDTERARIGGGLAVFGLVLPVAIGLGGLMHEATAPRLLSPVLATATAVVTLALLVTTGPGMQGFWSRPLAPAMLSTVAVLTVVGALVAFVAPVQLDPPTTVHAGMELAVAAGWFAAVALVRHRRGASGSPGFAVDGRVLAALGAVWLLRTLAVYDVEGWGVSHAVLLVVVSVVVVTHAMRDFVAAAESEHSRLDEAERAASVALGELTRGRQRRRALRHDARSTAHALRLAAQALAEHGESMDAEARQRLQVAIRDEATALGELLESADESDTGERSSRGEWSSPPIRP